MVLPGKEISAKTDQKQKEFSVRAGYKIDI